MELTSRWKQNSPAQHLIKYPTSCISVKTRSQPNYQNQANPCADHLLDQAPLPILSSSSFGEKTRNKSGWLLTHMEKSSCLRTLELQKASCLHAQAIEVSPNKVEWKKVKENGRGWLDKIKVSAPIKGSTFYPQKQLTLVAASLPATMRIH
ncbi:hypothetical protein L3X38_006480 [Prunus dulcis]|uniref:Uncharacterized protein n=1 Tax=Prunus dulcis TaxID=3755 RepID=A0AAD4ZT27_PRUDU|nr:hypothetical protein L3X38_006480 [Prunus dulcis]